VADNWYAGNAGDAIANRGWILGYFIDPTQGAVRSTTDLEVKWGIHPAGDRRTEWTTGENRTTLLILIEGRWRLELSTGTVILSRQGDYVVWGPGIQHSWYAEKNSIVMTVRWPSRR
jgi:hypothetical protein